MDRDDGVAAEWLDVIATAPGPLVGRVSAFIQGIVGIALGGLEDTFGPCRVVVVRRDTGAEVAGFRHWMVGEAGNHFDSLRTRLTTMRYFDFCREVGIPFDVAMTVRPPHR